MSGEAGGYDALVVISYGGPEGPDDVLPFLRNATRGRDVPHERLLEVAQHYHHFGGVSPINAQNRELVAALEAAVRADGNDLPVYLGNRNWHPFLHDVVREMRDMGIRKALALVTSAYSSYSGCGQYLEDIARARAVVGDDAPWIDKLGTFHDNPGFIAANADRLRETLHLVEPRERHAVHVVFSAHSIPLSMARRCAYEAQLNETCRLVADSAGVRQWTLAYQSRSGPPQIPWLGPDISDSLAALAANGVQDVAVAPIGFVSDHMEVVYDLDCEARELARELGLRFHRAATAGTHPAFVNGLRALIGERCAMAVTGPAGVPVGPGYGHCAADCCTSKR